MGRAGRMEAQWKQPVWMIRTIPNPDGDGRVAVTVLRPGAGESVTVDDPRVVGGRRLVDVVRVRVEEGEREGTYGVVPRKDVEPPLN